MVVAKSNRVWTDTRFKQRAITFSGSNIKWRPENSMPKRTSFVLVMDARTRDQVVVTRVAVLIPDFSSWGKAVLAIADTLLLSGFLYGGV